MADETVADIHKRLAELPCLEHSNALGRLQGQFVIIVALQLAQITGLVAVVWKVFGG